MTKYILARNESMKTYDSVEEALEAKPVDDPSRAPMVVYEITEANLFFVTNVEGE